MGIVSFHAMSPWLKMIGDGTKGESRKHWACFGDLQRRIFAVVQSRRGSGLVRIFRSDALVVCADVCLGCSTPGKRSRFAAPELLSLSGIVTCGAYCNPLRNLEKNRLAA